MQPEFAGVRAAIADEYRGSGAPAQLTPMNIGRVMLGAICAGDQDMLARIQNEICPASERFAPMEIAPCETLTDHCTRTSTEPHVVLPASDVALPELAPYRTDESCMACLSDAEWVPGWDFVIAADGTVISDCGYAAMTMPVARRPHIYFAAHKAVGYYRPEALIELEHETFWLSGPVLNHIGHWMIDFLPRLYGLRYLDPAVKIAVPDTIGAKQIESLAMFGIGGDRLFFCADDAVYRFKRLHIYRAGRSMPPNPVHVGFTSNYLAAPGRARNPNRRIFLTRGSVGTRLIANDVEFAAFIAGLGFETANIENMTFAEQQVYFRNASIILGAFGSALFALYFAPPGCTVIVLADEKMRDPALPKTCAILDQRYLRLNCDPAAHTARTALAKDRDIVVDCAALSDLLGHGSAVAV